MNENKLLAIFAIFALLVSIPATNFAYAGDSSQNYDGTKDTIEEEKEEPGEEQKEEPSEEQNENYDKDREIKKELKEEKKEKIEQEKERKKELREEYKIKLEAKKKIFLEYKKELKEKFNALKNEFKEKYAQLRISSSSDPNDDTDDEIESEIKRKELRLLKLEFRENLKNLKLEAKQHFDEFKSQLSDQKADRKNKIQDRINEIKEKYKNKIREQEHQSTSDLENYSTDFEGKKIDICHVPPGNPDDAHTVSISVNALRSHLAHGDYIGECEVSDDETIDENINNEETETEVETEVENEVEIEVEIEDGIAKILVKIGDEEQEFDLEETDRELIIQYIADNTDLTIGEIESHIEFEDDKEVEGQNTHIEIKEELGISQEP